jgi:hypothetical protein
MCKIEFNVFTANVLYCSSPDGAPVTKICYVKFDDSQSTGVALHLNNTVFIDKALIIVPVMDGKYNTPQIGTIHQLNAGHFSKNWTS